MTAVHADPQLTRAIYSQSVSQIPKNCRMVSTEKQNWNRELVVKRMHAMGRKSGESVCLNPTPEASKPKTRGNAVGNVGAPGNPLGPTRVWRDPAATVVIRFPLSEATTRGTTSSDGSGGLGGR